MLRGQEESGGTGSVGFFPLSGGLSSYLLYPDSFLYGWPLLSLHIKMGSIPPVFGSVF